MKIFSNFLNKKNTNEKEIWRIAWPMILTSLSIPITGAVDTGVAGHFGEIYIGSVAVGAITFSFIYWALGFLRMGTTGFTAQAVGSNNKNEVISSAIRAFILALFLGLFLVMIKDQIVYISLFLINPDKKIKEIATIYLSIRIFAAPSNLIILVGMGWLLGQGLSKIALFIQITTNLINAILSIVLGIFYKLKVFGIVIATVTAEIIGSLLTIIIFLSIVKGNYPSLKKVLNLNKIKLMLVSNLDIFIRTLCVISAMSMFTAIGARIDNTILAANAILVHMQSFISHGLDGFAHATENVVGKAIGAKNQLLLKRVVIASLRMAIVTALLYSLVYLFLGEKIIKLFTNDPLILKEAFNHLPWLILSPIISVWSFHLDGVFIGATRTREMRNAMIYSFLIFLISLYILIPIWENHGLWAAYMIFMIFRTLTLCYFYKNVKIAAAK